MKVLKEIYDSPWDFILYQTDEGYVINIEYSNSAIDFSRSFKLSEAEANLGFDELKQLSDRIRKDYESFKDREITPAITK